MKNYPHIDQKTITMRNCYDLLDEYFECKSKFTDCPREKIAYKMCVNTALFVQHRRNNELLVSILKTIEHQQMNDNKK